MPTIWHNSRSPILNHFRVFEPLSHHKTLSAFFLDTSWHSQVGLLVKYSLLDMDYRFIKVLFKKNQFVTFFLPGGKISSTNFVWFFLSQQLTFVKRDKYHRNALIEIYRMMYDSMSNSKICILSCQEVRFCPISLKTLFWLTHTRFSNNDVTIVITLTRSIEW